jgi:hypothetical protein
VQSLRIMVPPLSLNESLLAVFSGWGILTDNPNVHPIVLHCNSFSTKKYAPSQTQAEVWKYRSIGTFIIKKPDRNDRGFAIITV